MAFITYPLNNIDYTAEDAELFHCTRTSGIWAEDSFPISVTGADNNVTIGTGIAWINNEEFSGKVAALKSAEVLDLGIANSTHPRIDVIAIQYSANNNATDVVIKKGTPATNPVRPAIVRSGAVYELYLASIYRPAGATAITASNITDLRMDTTVCGLMADSVTKVDMDAIRAQLIGLVEELEEAIQNIEVGEIVPIEKGGTNAQTSAIARQNINFIGIDPLTSPAEDTVGNWIALGSGIAYISDEGVLANQPERYGYILNIVNDPFVSQLFFTQNSSVHTYKRAGAKTSTWYNRGNWTKMLDENNGVQIEKIWENASLSSDFAAQTITLDDYSSKCDLFIMEFRTLKGYYYETSAIARKGFNQSINDVIDIAVNGSAPTFAMRRVLVASGSATFTDCNIKTASDTVLSVNNGYIIPTAIYGIKGVL